jgi:hypothetical protein
MKAYKVELLIIDHDDLGQFGILDEIKNTRYANDSISPKIIAISERDIGDWNDDHPLNSGVAWKDEYHRLFYD